MNRDLFISVLFIFISLPGCSAFHFPSFAGAATTHPTPVLPLSKRSGIYLQGATGGNPVGSPSRVVGVTAVVRYSL